MISYKVVVDRFAKDSLSNIHNYIATVLLEPMTAKNQIKRLLNAIESLDSLPKRHPLYYKEPWLSKGLRRLLVDKYVIVYKVDDENKTVAVVAVMNTKRDTEYLLERL
ncbi:MAG: type II toxin-antitoxin system RelE/ParE family toxin [Oscillospiraceae bacterium]|jgi:toxin ParE1/3/4|nr:type II toxin-antitoxin system RelE/ParE family toxin [Oscillospiraceae bacterium]